VAVPKLRVVTADTALCTWVWASLTAASKSVLFTHPPDAETEGGVVATGVEDEEDVLEHAPRINIESAAAIPHRCIE
jgi:hypothetical protein